MKEYRWDTSKPYHKQEVYVAAREALKSGKSVTLHISSTGEHKDIPPTTGWLSSLKTCVAVMADLEWYVDGLTTNT